VFSPSPSSDDVNDEDVADKEAAEREEIDKDKEREMIDHIESIRIHAIEDVKGPFPLHHQL
jgi:predicted  nucleic acid-binding Zn-ribbon protein